MEYFFTVMFVLLSIITAFLFWQLRAQRHALSDAVERLHTLDPSSAKAREPEIVLTLKVIDPIALAKRESRSARILADRLPVMTRKMVYQQVMAELSVELDERGIDVEMNIEYR
ncbi:hypothetical protein [Marinobacter caseinilyticus]|uniref:hypothetical protein n=1 Tax=Marinobacter caseinilyticus TaxID=2692195 RepID=UPI001F3BDD6E|nr:hypothetical protein [Marinobacter caseinilyticus]